MAEQKMNKEEQVGFHKGALSVLAVEQNEFGKIMQAIQAQIQAHVNALKELGVDIVAESKKAMEEMKAKEGTEAAAHKDDNDDIANRLS